MLLQRILTKHPNVLRSIFNVFIRHKCFIILSIKPFHLDEITHLPLIHGDPFDRLIISQAITENLVIITKDGTISQYDVKVLW